jgi:hypothetical protein
LPVAIAAGVDDIASIRDRLTFRPYADLESCELWLEPSGILYTPGLAVTG